MSHNDPVCGMQIDEERALWQASHRDRSFYFCSLGCREEFETDPFRYSCRDLSWIPADR